MKTNTAQPNELVLLNRFVFFIFIHALFHA